MWVANAGDSRAIIARRGPNGSLITHDLTEDQKPDTPAEKVSGARGVAARRQRDCVTNARGGGGQWRQGGEGAESWRGGRGSDPSGAPRCRAPRAWHVHVACMRTSCMAACAWVHVHAMRTVCTELGPSASPHTHRHFRR